MKQVKRYLPYLIAAVVVTVVLYIVVRKRKSARASLVNDVSKAIKTKNLTMSAPQYTAIADAIGVAVHGFGTDEDAIYKAMQKLNTIDDLYAVIAAFGTRNNDDTFDLFNKSNLVETLVGDLTESELKKVNDILAQKGINYKF